jgi:hypothetical protein
MFQTKVVEKLETHFYVQCFFVSKTVPLLDKMEKYCRVGLAKVITWLMRIECWIPKATNTHTQVV